MFKIFFLVLLIYTLAISKVLNASSSLKIIDGDTIILNSEKIRFYGIDTPEIKQTCTDNHGHAYSCGVRAKLELEKIIGLKKYHALKKQKTDTKDLFRYAM